MNLIKCAVCGDYIDLPPEAKVNASRELVYMHMLSHIVIESEYVLEANHVLCGMRVAETIQNRLLSNNFDKDFLTAMHKTILESEKGRPEMDHVSKKDVTKHLWFEKMEDAILCKQELDLLGKFMGKDIQVKQVDLEPPYKDEVVVGLEVAAPIYTLWFLLDRLDKYGIFYVTDIGLLVN